MRIPESGLPSDVVFEKMEQARSKDMRWRAGQAFAYVYYAGDVAEAVGKEAYSSFLTENGLDPTSFPSLLRFENEVVGMVLDHLGGGPRSAGSFTSGGTESIMLAMKSAREHARTTRPELFEGGRRPAVVLPTTAHAAFHKAADYLELRLILVSADQTTFKADVAAMAAAIDDDTILLVGSSPSYAHGVIDPIEDLAALAAERGLLMHVDACVGGFLLPFFAECGADVPPFDLSVPGVTSLSVDLHKYAFCPKGASLVLYTDKALREKQIFACTEWSGYSVVNPTVQSSKTGGPLAAAWAVLNLIGRDGYLDIAARTLAGTRELIAAVQAMDGLDVLGTPEFCMVAASSEEVSVFHVVDEMKLRGWTIHGQFAFDGSPANIHLSVGPQNAGRVAPMVDDLAASVEAARALPTGTLSGMAEGFAGVDPATIDEDMIVQMLAMVGAGGTELPDRMGPINEVLDALPRNIGKRLLVGFINELFQASR